MKEPANREETIFHALLQLPPASRVACLAAACEGDPDLRERVRKLLEAHAQSEQFFKKEAIQIASGEDKATLIEPTTDGPGTVIGRYKIREKIGEGGCGTVYVAEQEVPVRRRVALKVIKLGMDTKSVIARFEAERQALAMMDHPNIAKVLDAGATEAGRPYFVMELVRGIKITDYCDQNNLTTNQRLDLFIKVCQAVQHAHQKGIIHRDLKPSNILVTLHDGVPVPKVIDFGIAKATEGRLTNLTIYTELFQFMGTPAYMSPEQAEMSGLDIDTRSDVYSLGVLLYELLTGKTPFDAKELLEAGLDEMRRTIREKEPARPSTCLSTMLAADLTATAKRRQTESPRLVNLVRGDLDWIVMKALEKDRTRRYDTANGFAADIQRYLTSEPVSARPPSPVYKLRKAVRRNRLAFAAATAVALALLAGAVVSYLQAARARRAESLAKSRLAEVAAERDAKEAARQEAEEVSKFLQGVFQSPDPARDGRSITVAETLDRAVERLEKDLKSQPDRQARLRATLAQTYFDLGLFRTAVPLLENVRAYWVGKAGLENADSIASMQHLANGYLAMGRREEALKLREETLVLSQKVLGPEHKTSIKLMANLANSLAREGRYADALKLFEEALALHRKAVKEEDSDRVKLLWNVGEMNGLLDRHDEARKMAEETLALSRRINGANHPTTLSVMGLLARSLRGLDRPSEALPIAEELVVVSRKVFGLTHELTFASTADLASLYGQLKRHEDALKANLELLSACQNQDGTDTAVAVATLNLVGNYQSLGRFAEALKAAQEAGPLTRKAFAPDYMVTWQAMQTVGGCYARAGRFREARTELNPYRTLEIPDGVHVGCLSLAALDVSLDEISDYKAYRSALLARFGATTNTLIAQRIAMASLLIPAAPAETALAAELADRALNAPTERWATNYYRSTVGLAHYRLGRWADAAASARKALQDSTNEDEATMRAQSHFVLAMAAHRLEQPDQAQTSLLAGTKFLSKFPLNAPDLSDEWHDILIARVLAREARELMGLPQ